MRRAFEFLISPALALLLVAGAVQASGKKPPPEKPKAEKKASLKDAKDDANRVLNNLDQGIHQAAGEAKEAGNKALQAVDDTLHGRKK